MRLPHCTAHRPIAALVLVAVVSVAPRAAGDVPAPLSHADIGLSPGTVFTPHMRHHRVAALADRGTQPPTLPPSRKQQLDDLFRRLGAATDTAEAEGIAGMIRRAWLRSGSETADLLMSRANTAMDTQKLDLAEKLLDKVVVIEPDWAEGWNRRATVRFHRDNDGGSMVDIAQVLLREPRHFGALSGMGYIFQRHGMPKQALKVFRRVLQLYPQQDNVRKVVDSLTLEVEGREI